MPCYPTANIFGLARNRSTVLCLAPTTKKKKIYTDFNFQVFVLLGQGTLLLNSILMNNKSYGALCIAAYALYFNAAANIMTKVFVL